MNLVKFGLKFWLMPVPSAPILPAPAALTQSAPFRRRRGITPESRGSQIKCRDAVSSYSFLTILFYAGGTTQAAELGAPGHDRLAGWRETGALVRVSLPSNGSPARHGQPGGSIAAAEGVEIFPRPDRARMFGPECGLKDRQRPLAASKLARLPRSMA